MAFDAEIPKPQQCYIVQMSSLFLILASFHQQVVHEVYLFLDWCGGLLLLFDRNFD